MMVADVAGLAFLLKQMEDFETLIDRPNQQQYFSK